MSTVRVYATNTSNEPGSTNLLVGPAFANGAPDTVVARAESKVGAFDCVFTMDFECAAALPAGSFQLTEVRVVFVAVNTSEEMLLYAEFIGGDNITEDAAVSTMLEPTLVGSSGGPTPFFTPPADWRATWKILALIYQTGANFTEYDIDAAYLEFDVVAGNRKRKLAQRLGRCR